MFGNTVRRLKEFAFPLKKSDGDIDYRAEYAREIGLKAENICLKLEIARLFELVEKSEQAKRVAESELKAAQGLLKAALDGTCERRGTYVDAFGKVEDLDER